MGGEPVFLRRALARLGIFHLHGIDLGKKVIQAELNGLASQAAGKLEQRPGDCVQIFGAVSTRAVGGNFRVAGPGEEIESQSWIRMLLTAENVADGNFVVAVNVVAELVAHHEFEFRIVERFQQARSEHHEQAAILGLEAHGVVDR